jgi:hypothetical protein
LTSAGTAVLKFVPGGGVHSYNAVFLGTNGDAQSSSSAAALTVNGSYPTTTTIAQSGGPGDYTLTATVTGSHTTPPSGVVSFLDTTNANYALATTNLNLGSGESALSFNNSYTLFGPSYSLSGFPPGVNDDDFAQAYIGDFNGDGKLDLAVRWQYYSVRDSVYNAWVQELDILLGNGNGTFTAAPAAVPLSEGLEFFDVVTGDFNNDGKEDLAVLLANDSVLVLLGNGDGTFKTLPPIPVPTGTESIVTGDFNRDGNLDLVLTIYTAEDIKPVDEAHVWVYITTLLGNGDGTFQSPLPTPSQQIYANLQGNPAPPAIGDFNRDGILDLALMNINTKELDVFTGKGDGTFQSTPIVSQIGDPNTANVLVGDFNQDGILDLAEETFGTILLGNGDGTFTPEANPGTINDGGDMVIGDFNGDGIADLADITFPGAVVQLGNGDGTFSPPVTVTPASGPLALTLTAGDFNGDGMSDLALGAYGLFPTSDTSFPGPPELFVELAHLTGSATATATVSGISPVGTGTHWVDASYQGDSSYAGSVSATTPLIAEPITTSLSLTANLSGAGEQFLLTATLTPSQAQNHSASGMITFYNNGVSLGQGTVTNGVATLTTILPLGIDSITAMYPGDTNFTSSTSIAVPLNLDFSISGSTNSPTVYTGQSATYTVTVMPNADFNLPVTLSCTLLPANTTCSFSPASVAGGSGSSTLVVQTNAPRPASSASALFTKARIPLLAGLILLIIPTGLRRNRKGWPMLPLIFALLAAAMSVTACGSPGQLTGATPVGTQTITITGTATNGSQTLTHTANVTLNVKSLF